MCYSFTLAFIGVVLLWTSRIDKLSYKTTHYTFAFKILCIAQQTDFGGINTIQHRSGRCHHNFMYLESTVIKFLHKQNNGASL